MRRLTFYPTVLATILGVCLYQGKNVVEREQNRLTETLSEIKEKQESIRILRAEWTYLNEPSRLQRLTEEHLRMQPVRGGQISAIEAIPMRIGPVEEQSPRAGEKTSATLNKLASGGQGV